MKQYLLSVHSVADSPLPPTEKMQQMYTDVAAFNTTLKAAGVWVFAGGLQPPSIATVVRVQDGDVLTTDGPFAEGKEHIVGSGTRKARAISVVLRPPSSRSVSATWAPGARAGWQQVKIRRSRSSLTAISLGGSPCTCNR